MPPERAKRPLASLRPMPVSVTMPTMMPAMAQATATLMVLRAPISRASKKAEKLMRVSLRNMLTTMEVKMA